MKRYLIIFTILFALLQGCGQTCNSEDCNEVVIEPVSDTIAKIPDEAPIADTLGEGVLPCDSFIKAGNVLLRRQDSLIRELFIAHYKINRVKYYLAIVNRKPSQAKFLRSWITRAVK